MAIQNFISGGYYGKLGATVGQRWKNKRTVRAYVIPKNPRTEKQQANRNVFKDALPYAQMGMAANFKAPCWNLPNTTEWNARVSEVRKKQKAGVSGISLIPLFPDSFTPAYSITNFEATTDYDPDNPVLLVSGNLPQTNRNMSVFVANMTGGVQQEPFYCSGVLNVASTPQLEISLPSGKQLNVNDWVVCCSIDDSDAQNDMVVSPALQANPPAVVTKEFNTTVTNREVSLGQIIITFAQPEINGTCEASNVVANCWCRAVQGSYNPTSVTMRASGGFMQMVINYDAQHQYEKWLFSPSNQISVGRVYGQEPGVYYEASNFSIGMVGVSDTTVLDQTPEVYVDDTGNYFISFPMGSTITQRNSLVFNAEVTDNQYGVYFKAQKSMRAQWGDTACLVATEDQDNAPWRPGSSYVATEVPRLNCSQVYYELPQTLNFSMPGYININQLPGDSEVSVGGRFAEISIIPNIRGMPSIPDSSLQGVSPTVTITIQDDVTGAQEQVVSNPGSVSFSSSGVLTMEFEGDWENSSAGNSATPVSLDINYHATLSDEYFKDFEISFTREL